MPPDEASEETFASGRYSKRERAQVNYRMLELDADEDDADTDQTEIEADTDVNLSDADNDESGADTDQPKTDSDSEAESESDAEYTTEIVPKKIHPMFKKRCYSKRVPKPFPKRKVFPFLELPAEVRNMIYSCALSDPIGLNFIATIRERRHITVRVCRSEMRTYTNRGKRFSYYHQSTRIDDDELEVTHVPTTPMAPALLAVNKQLFEEASSFLYNNELVFGDTVVLYAFLLNLGPTGVTHLKKIRLFNWNDGNNTKSYGNSCFALLTPAVNISSFFIQTGKTWYNTPKSAAQRFYRDAYPWLEAVGRANGKADAVLDIVHVDYTRQVRPDVQGEMTTKKKTEFEVVLRNLLLQAERKRMARMK